MTSQRKNGMILHLKPPSPPQQSGLLQTTNWHDNITPTDINVPWLYEAHSLTVLLIVISVIFYCCFSYPGSQQLGAGLVVFLFFAVGCLVFPAGPFMRPHPIFWRFTFCISMAYTFILLYLLAQEPEDARATLRIMLNDDTIGYPLPERSYAEDCALEWRVIYNVLDRFLFAHLFGWVIKALVIRDRRLCWILSILWEIIELVTKYFIPNFAECWWDQLILDVIICNGLGIEGGLFIIRWWYGDPQREKRDWLGKYDVKGIALRFKRLFIQLIPGSISPMYWEPLSSMKRYFQVHILLIGVCLVEFNSFTLKLFLYIPTEHPLHIWRLVIFTFWFTVSCKQWYLFLTNAKCKKLGSQIWICFVMLMFEVALSCKCAPRPFPAMPFYIKVFWSITGVVWVVFTCVCFTDFSHVKVGNNLQISK